MIERGQVDSPAVKAWREAKAFNRRAVLLARAAAERGMPMAFQTARGVIAVIDECERRGGGSAQWMGAVGRAK